MGSETEEIIDEFMGDNPRAEEWRALRLSLADRLKPLERRLAEEKDSIIRASLNRQIATLRKQIEALGAEEVVSRFVEDSVRATLARPGVGMEQTRD